MSSNCKDFVKDYTTDYFGERGIEKMKKIAGAVCSVLLAWGLTAAPASAEEVTVTLPTFPVVLNGITMDQTNNQYPMLVYKDITYVAMTYHDARLLGLESGWNDSAGLMIQKALFVADKATLQGNYKPYHTDTANGASYQAVLPEFPITVNNKSIDNRTEEYPLLTFRDVTYFPLTWRFAVTEFGWNYSFDETNGLVITPVPTPVTTPPSSNGSNNTNGTNTNANGSNVNSGGSVSETGNTVKEGSIVVVNGTAVNLRSGPGTNYDKVGQVDKGLELTVIKEQDSWYQVRLSDGSTAWIASWLADLSVPSQGVLTPLTVVSSTPSDQKTTLVLKHGEYNKVTTNSANATQILLTMSNTTLDPSLNQLSFPVGPVQQVSAAATGTNAVQLTLRVQPGAYASIKEEGDNVTITVRSRQIPNTTGIAGKTIMLDPGHGGSDQGAIGSFLGVTDAAVGLDVAKKLQTMLAADGANVVLTRNEDTNLALYDRPTMSNAVEPDIFVSIHGNAVENKPLVNGIEVYYYAPSNSANLYAQAYVRKELANAVEQGLVVSTARKTSTRTANYAVLRENNSPSILVECGYLTNQEEEALLGTDAYRQKLAEGIYHGIVKYFNMY